MRSSLWKDLPTDPMIGQVEGNIMARSSRPNNDGFPSNVLRGRVMEGVGNLPLEFFLQATTISLVQMSTGGTGRKNLFGFFWNTA